MRNSEKFKKIKLLSQYDKTSSFLRKCRLCLDICCKYSHLPHLRSFFPANPNGEVGNNLEVVSHFAIKVMMFCGFDIKRHPAKFDLNRERKNVELTTKIDNLASRF